MLFHNDYNNSPAPAYGFNLLGPPWTLTYELFFYAIFGLSMSISHKYRALICSLIIISSVVLLQFVFNNSFSISSQASANLYISHWWQVPVKILSTTILFEFIAGMILADMYDRVKIKRKNSFPNLMLLLGVILFSVQYYYGSMRILGFMGGFWVALPLFASFIYYDRINKVRKNKTLIFLGDISYSLYISHFLFLSIAMKYIPNNLGVWTGIGVFVTLVCAALAFSALLHFAVEKPFIQLGQRYVKERWLFKPPVSE